MMKKYILQILFVCTVFSLAAAEKVLFAPESMKDWCGAIRKTTVKNKVFDTGNDLFVLISGKSWKIDPAKTYRLSGDFKLKPYAPFGNIYFGLILLDHQGKEFRRLPVGRSPLNDRVVPNNKEQVRNFWLTFSGTVPSETFKFPPQTAAVKVILNQFENYKVDMVFKNIRLIEE